MERLTDEEDESGYDDWEFDDVEDESECDTLAICFEYGLKRFTFFVSRTETDDWNWYDFNSLLRAVNWALKENTRNERFWECFSHGQMMHFLFATRDKFQTLLFLQFLGGSTCSPLVNMGMGSSAHSFREWGKLLTRLGLTLESEGDDRKQTSIIPPESPLEVPTANNGTSSFPGFCSKWRNSLGMEFVVVGGTEVLFSIWATRVKDYEEFVKATGRQWEKAGFEQGPEHPAVNVSWDDAKAFCLWLTEKENKEGVLARNKCYRLPTDMEWSAAVGLPKEEGKTPQERDMKIKGVYPWGTQWPPPKGAGNYDSSLKVDEYEYTWGYKEIRVSDQR